jgi:hypothetical protein
MRGANLIADASCRLTDDLYPVKHRVLQLFVDVEARPVVPDVAPNRSPSRPKRSEIRRPFLLRWTWHNESFPRYHMLPVS